MGIVYRATQLSLGREVALKLMRRDLARSTEARERFRAEALRQAALEHPKVVAVHDTGDSPHGPYIAMALVRGRDLRRAIVADELGVARGLRILAGVASALDTAHDLGLVHRDVKPHNILVDADHGYLTDFGLSTNAGLHPAIVDGRAGTPAYMAPEQVRGEPATASSDIYALGAVLYECVTRSPPFLRNSDIEVMCAHLYSPAPSVRAVRPELSRALDRAVIRAMAKLPGHRQRTATQLIAQAGSGIAGGDLPRR
jgi:serine/threonine protein kinase